MASADENYNFVNEPTTDQQTSDSKNKHDNNNDSDQSKQQQQQQQSASCSSASKTATENSATGGGGWFSWYNDAKSKTLSTFDLVKRDLSEFGEVVGQQASATLNIVSGAGGGTGGTSQATAIASTAQHFGAKAGQWVKTLAQQVNDTVLKMNDTLDDDDEQVEKIIVKESNLDSDDDDDDDDGEEARKNNGTRRRDTKNAPKINAGKLLNIQSDPNTFLNEPIGAPELYEDWLDHFDLSAKNAEIRSLLATSENSPLRTNYAELVPSKISHGTFWERYFYKIHQFELEQSRLEAFLEKATVTTTTTGTNNNVSSEAGKKSPASSDSGEVSWGDDSDLDELTTLMAEKQFENSTVISDSTATAILEQEDKKQQKIADKKHDQILSYSKTNTDGDGKCYSNPTNSNSNNSPSDVLSLTGSIEVVALMSQSQETNGGQEDIRLATVSPNNNNNNEIAEIRSENSFCIINSGPSSENGDVTLINTPPNFN